MLDIPYLCNELKKQDYLIKMDKKNYYQILGITDNEKKLSGKDFENVIKRKYKKLAVKYHPDKWTNASEQEKKDAEDKFKDIAEAYSVLSDSTKRSQYDNPSSGFNFGDFMNFDMADFMRDFGFGMHGFNRNSGNQIIKGQSIRIKLKISLEDAYNGVVKKIKYDAYDNCQHCNGSGADKDSTIETCPHCGGTGMIMSQNGYVQTMSTCRHCGGKGTWIKNPCKKCNGNGVISNSREIEITIPKGVDSGYAFEISGGGNAPVKSNGKGVNGDLLVVIEVDNHDKFVRQGNDLLFELDVPVLDAITGKKIEVTTIDGSRLSCEVPQCVSDGYGLKFKGKGMPVINSNNYGNMIAIVRIKMPTSVTSEEINIINELKEKGSFK